MSLPSRERGLKRFTAEDLVMTAPSLPSRERGLKRANLLDKRNRFGSLPSRERGLKRVHRVDHAPIDIVAPFTGAWIETSNKG